MQRRAAMVRFGNNGGAVACPSRQTLGGRWHNGVPKIWSHHQGENLMRFAAAAFAAVFTSCAHAADAVKVTPPQQKVLASENGRFVFGQISEYRRDQYMLDTQTGRVWKIVLRKAKNSDGTDAPGDGFEVLEVVPYVDLEGKMSVGPR